MLENPFVNQNPLTVALPKDADFNREVANYLLQNKSVNSLYIVGPKVFDYSKYSTLPLYVYSTWKKTSNPNSNLYPLKQCTMVVSSHETGEIFVLPLVDLSVKKSQTFNKEPFPVQNMDMVNSGFIYNTVCRYLSKENEIPTYNGHFTVFVVCDNVMSNLYEGCIENADLNPKDCAKITGIHSPYTSLSDKQRILFSRSDKSPESPEKPLIRLNVQQENSLEPGKSFIISGSFCFVNSVHLNNKIVPIHIVLTRKTHKKTDFFELDVPLDLCNFDEDMIQGYFAFDLMERFYRSDENAFYIPQRICITIVHKNLIIAPTEIVLRLKQG